MVEHSYNVRLVPLDAWERNFIKEIVKERMLEAQHVPEENATNTLRLDDLLKKVDPVYPPPENGKLVGRSSWSRR